MTTKPYALNIRLPEVDANSQQISAASRQTIDDLTGHYGLSANKVVQLALRALHRQVFPERYAGASASFDHEAIKAGGWPLTETESAHAVADSLLTGKQFAAKHGLGDGVKVQTLGDIFQQAKSKPTGKATGKATGKGTSKAASKPALKRPAKTRQV